MVNIKGSEWKGRWKGSGGGEDEGDQADGKVERAG